MNSIYDASFKTPDGKTVSLKDYAGKTLLIVNTATKCGLAGQFKELEQLHQDYKAKGLVVIGFPCDQFLGQEPETNESMVGVCQLNFGVTFQLSEKVYVNGPKTHQVFKFIKKKGSGILGRSIKWNFTKFLISPDGITVKKFAPTVAPNSMRADIEALIATKSL
jgi:glutathione peroxidase